ncbi:hypothetical protein SAMN05421803_13210 [Nocardiopsis flavescens]|uniref:Uncharacterized protein n=1 Tax=Nocardiopsis flavescens TaxID=758803 RepID=A0A1M6V5J3_9ACTN|nr:hypothetical protein [Nocardiopsis flavescens]SHK76762.1 hypothetical protein SAMN05421803_13210 [Nocardiopsis flavescens]
MKNLYARLLSELTLPKGDDGYSTETVIITAVLVGIALAAVAAIGAVADTWIAQIGSARG